MTGLLAGAPAVARADAPVDVKAEAMKLAGEGVVAYRAGRFAAALAKFEAAYSAYPAPALVLDLSHAELKLGHCDKAMGYALTYGAAFSVDARASMDSPEAVLEAVKAECSEVEITSSPAGAEFIIDGVRQAPPFVTPWKGRLPVGTYSILARHDGFSSRRVTLTVAAREVGQVHVELAPTSPMVPVGTAAAVGSALVPLPPDALVSRAPAAVEPVPATPATAAPPPTPADLRPPATAEPTVREETRSSGSGITAAAPPATRGGELPAAATAPAPTAAHRTARSLGWAGIIIGAAALAVGIGLGVAGRTEQTAVHTTIVPNAAAALEKADAEAIGADALLGIGGALGAVGTGLVVAF